MRGVPIELPRREYSLLEILVGELGHVIDKRALASRLFGFDDSGGPNAIELYVGRLRKRLAGSGLVIRTVRGTGYLAEAGNDEGVMVRD